MEINHITTGELIDILPENRSLYKDSGLWSIRDESDNPILEQNPNESLRQFIVRYIGLILNRESNESFETDLFMLSYNVPFVSDWTKVDGDNIDVPDELMPLFNSIGNQLRFHTISGKNEMLTVAHMVYKAQKFFSDLFLLNAR